MSIVNTKNLFLSPRYSLPKRAGDLRRLGQLFGSACAIECAEIIERYNGPVMLITSDTQCALRLNHEIQPLTKQKVIRLSDWENLPYENLSPHQATISSRLSILYDLPTMTRGVIILSVNTLMQRVCPSAFLHSCSLVISKGQYWSCDKLRRQLEQVGYRYVEQVMTHGEFSIRRSLFDLYPMGSDGAYRINFCGKKISSVRTFDIDSQCTISDADAINLLPAHEFPTEKNAIKLFRSQWRERFDVLHHPEHVYQQVSRSIWPAGIEYWQPLFFSQSLPSLFSYLPLNTLIINIGDLESAATCFWQVISQRYEKHCIDPMRPPLSPDTLWLSVDTLLGELTAWPRITLEIETLPAAMNNMNLGYYALPNLAVQSHNPLSLKSLQRFIIDFDGSVIFLVKSEARRQMLQDVLGRIKLSTLLIQYLDQAQSTGYYIIICACEHGFLDSNRNRALISESDLLGKHVNCYQKDNRCIINIDTLIRNLTELHPGQPVVHLQHGIGRYLGLTTLMIRDIQTEYLILSYMDEDKLYVPISSLHLISRYSGGSDDTAPLHKLGGDSWERIKQKTVEQVRDIAAELLDIYTQRTTKTGFAFKHNHEKYQLFCRSFPFDLTPDQEAAINAMLSDMCQPLAMDRLVCGDVGFGKTEVAMRAAFLAVDNGKQVAMLVPTTLLAKQHFDNFRDRFSAWPIRIEMISRFLNAKEQTQVLDATDSGNVDILIGTHKLLQADVRWKDLGLLIVDEEHRFGVHHKEKIKAMRSNIDILTLTATPIPRTLNMATIGIRDLSIIATPPARRLAVKTFIREYDSLVVREAILREVLRGGQVYYLYNDVENIEQTAKNLADLVPEAHITVGHGQMRERDLECVMNDFQRQRFNVLVCTTIIETGIDISSVNTIIIERADRFGLAQLHQLRGRVGRSHHQAYAYFLTSHPQTISANAKSRLTAITSMEDLGAGFALATHDLEIRGAGELLGEDQSGQISTTGFSVYMELLENAVDALKNGREPSLTDLVNKQVEIELRMPTLLPNDFVPDVNTRLLFYKRIASAKNNDDLRELKMELIDRFGVLPEPAKNLFRNAFLRQYAQMLGIKRIESNERSGFIEFGDQNHIDPSYLISLLKSNPQVYRLDGPNKLKFVFDVSDRKRRLEFIEDLLSACVAHKLVLPA
ncbi:transcription-repair coupling factor [Candidatus Gillettellia adelgis]